MAQQENDKSYDVYINRLRCLIKNCQYGALENDIMGQDQIGQDQMFDQKSQFERTALE